ncbi:uncharacterized protein [Triticum aestivum]|uniref:uncharacterized protein n=1 Tax=Triticum aestivum TaxID=4565 RepID=UPI001D003179|nr:uncharacterized protein LOC123057239 [Triticum aestivum]
MADAFQSEAVAMLYAINIASQMGCDRVMFETDSTQLRRVVSTEEYDLRRQGRRRRSSSSRRRTSWCCTSSGRSCAGSRRAWRARWWRRTRARRPPGSFLRGTACCGAGAVVEADPCAATPWELLARHGLLRSGHGYFFAARRRGEGAQARRTPEGGGGGKWMHSGSKEHRRSVTELGVVARWSMTLYCFYSRGGVRGEDGAQQGRRRSTGWAMSEYEITDPRCYLRADDGEEDHYWVLCHVRRSVKKNLKPRSWECWKSWDLQQFSEHEGIHSV